MPFYKRFIIKVKLLLKITHKYLYIYHVYHCILLYIGKEGKIIYVIDTSVLLACICVYLSASGGHQK